MKIKDAEIKKKIIHRLNRISGQINAVSQMIEDEASVQKIGQQLSAARSALTQALYEEFFAAMDKTIVKKGDSISEKDLEELRALLKGIK